MSQSDEPIEESLDSDAHTDNDVEELLAEDVDVDALKQAVADDAGASGAPDELVQRVTDLESQVKSEKDRALRAVAEMENFKRRKLQEFESFKKYANETVIKELLPILDSFDRALSVDVEAGHSDSDLKTGFELIFKQFSDLLAKLNVKEIDALDQQFDPNVHQAISQVEKEGVESGIVVEVMQKGFLLHDRVIRPSMVVVSQ